MLPLVKICGVRSVADAKLAERLGAEFIGCVLSESSPRRATTAEVKAIAARTRARLVLVFRDPSVDEIRHASLVTGVRRVQVHQTRPLDLHELSARDLIVHRVLTVGDRLPECQPVATKRCPVVFDVGAGGTGCTFDWRLLGKQAPHFTFIAGGITPENLGALLCRNPYAIDVSSGVEAEPGVKDSHRMHELFATLRGVS